jgi:hypothetical protein
MKYAEFLDAAGRVIKDPGERIKLVRAASELYSHTPKPHPCGEAYIIATGPNTETCLACGEDFLVLD